MVTRSQNNTPVEELRKARHSSTPLYPGHNASIETSASISKISPYNEDQTVDSGAITPENTKHTDHGHQSTPKKANEPIQPTNTISTTPKRPTTSLKRQDNYQPIPSWNHGMLPAQPQPEIPTLLTSKPLSQTAFAQQFLGEQRANAPYNTNQETSQSNSAHGSEFGVESRHAGPAKPTIPSATFLPTGQYDPQSAPFAQRDHPIATFRNERSQHLSNQLNDPSAPQISPYGNERVRQLVSPYMDTTGSTQYQSFADQLCNGRRLVSTFSTPVLSNAVTLKGCHSLPTQLSSPRSPPGIISLPFCSGL